MRLKLKILGFIAVSILFSCSIPGKEVPSFENCPSFPKSWDFSGFGYASVLNFFVLDGDNQPIVIKVYTEEDKNYLELSRYEGDERKKVKTELAGKAEYLWATYEQGLVHVSFSETVNESSHVKYCLSDLTEWVCEELGYEGEPRIFVAPDSSVSMLVASSTELKYLVKSGNTWRNKGAVKFSGPAQGWTFSVFKDSLVAAVADSECALWWLGFDGSWTKENTGQKLCAPSLAGVGVFGFPFVIGKKNAEDSGKGIVFLDVLDEWAEFELDDGIEEVSAVYPDGCDKAFAIYMSENTLNRRAIRFETYSLEVGVEREIGLPEEYELSKILGVTLDTNRDPHMLLQARKDEQEMLLCAEPR